MRQDSLIGKAVKTLVDLDKTDLTKDDVKTALRPLVQDDLQMSKVLTRMHHHGYLRKVEQVTNRARRNFGRKEVF